MKHPSSRRLSSCRSRCSMAWFWRHEPMTVRSTEVSQDRARIAFRDLAELVRSVQSRVQALEAQAKLRLSTTQRGTIYQLVQTWGGARAERQKDQRSGEAIRTCWRLFNQRFGISTYTDLPAAQYDDAIRFIKEQYR